MSVFVSDFTTWTVVHDDAFGGAHSGTLDPVSITHPLKIDGTLDHSFLLVTCPVCAAVSTHPVGGGAQPLLVQQLFVNRITTNGCACGVVAAGNANVADAHAHLNCARMDGAERWQV